MTLAASDATSSVAMAVGLVAVLGVGAQWVAWRLKLPSILLLLVAGILFGPVARSVLPEGSPFALDPNGMLGSDLLLALVGVSVGLILYEGGLTLRFREIRTVKRTVVSLVTLGAAVTWVIAAAAAAILFALPVKLAVLLGALLVVTGPTVIGPMIGHIRPSGASGPVLRWEGIVIDPIGVLLAVLVFEAIVTGAGEGGSPVVPIARALAMTIVVGGGLGAFAALLMLRMMSRYWVPDSLQNPVSLMMVVAVFVVSNHFQQESGLLATTVMGIILANQRRADMRHILEFKESLRVLLIGMLFIVLAARLSFESLRSIDMGALIGFIVVLVVIARPAAVWASTIGAGLSTNERMFMAMLAPRGIVAAAGSSIFALGLESNGVEGAEALVPITFGVIIGTVALYGLAAAPVARVLGIADQNPQGIVFVGAAVGASWRWCSSTAACGW
ncbi:MAG: cation:proton antiporter [Phycisphaerales bacterium]